MPTSRTVEACLPGEGRVVSVAEVARQKGIARSTSQTLLRERSAGNMKGSTACPNTKRTSERKARHSIVQFAIEFLQSDDFRRWIEAGRRALEAQGG
jgi:hypothetical protein